MKTNYPIQVIDLRIPADHISPKTIRLLEEYRLVPANNPKNDRLYVMLIRRREIELLSEGNKLNEVKIIYLYKPVKVCFYICIYPCLINMKVLYFKDFMKKNNLKNDTMNESQLQNVYNYPI